MERSSAPSAMKRLLFALLLLSVLATPRAAPLDDISNHLTPSLNVIRHLVYRRLPNHAHDSFLFVLTDPPAVPALYDAYTVSDTDDGRILVQGVSPVAIAAGLYHYLKYYCQVDFYWSANRFAELPATLPPVNGTVHGGSSVKWRYYLNVVTVSYSTVWWDFERWEQEIDWMALNGINMPLAFTGQEYVTQQVFKSLGLNDTDLATFLGGPAFHAWQRMGNIQGSWPSPCPQSWIDSQWALQQKIISRLRAWGMTPVLPAFAGFVPRTIGRIFPHANLTNAASWAGFPPNLTSVTAIYPLDPEFLLIQRRYIHVQRELYGGWTSHVYNVDLYNELEPASFDLDYLKNSTHGVWKALKAGDENATWVMQGWLFTDATYWSKERVEALLAGAPNEDIIMLDLYSDAKPVWNWTDSYFGKPFIWNMLHDFGGNQGLYANLDFIGKEPLVALNTSTSMTGMGITMEGKCLFTNEIAYALMLEMPWRRAPVNTTVWVQDFIARRYGPERVSDDVASAWELLRTTVYENKGPANQGVVKSIFELRPALTGLVGRTGKHSTALTYNPLDLIQAWTLLLHASSDNYSPLRAVTSFRYDIVDLTRQVLVNLFIPIYERLIDPATPDRKRWAWLALDLLADLDEVLATDEHFLVGNWIRDARRWGRSEQEVAFMEYQARNQITLWGPNAEISDYASKQWSGLIRTYYLPRWRIFAHHLLFEDGFNITTYEYEISWFEEGWQIQTWGDREEESWEVVGETWDVIGKIRERWEAVARDIYKVSW